MSFPGSLWSPSSILRFPWVPMVFVLCERYPSSPPLPSLLSPLHTTLVYRNTSVFLSEYFHVRQCIGYTLCIFWTGTKDSSCMSEEPRSCSMIERVPTVVDIKRKRDRLERCKVLHCLLGWKKERKSWKSAILQRGELRRRLCLEQGRRINLSQFLEEKKSTPVHIGRSCATGVISHPSGSPSPSQFFTSILSHFELQLVEITKVRNMLHECTCEGVTIMACRAEDSGETTVSSLGLSNKTDSSRRLDCRQGRVDSQ